ncbi:MAG: Na/Pi cotransporter family protein, partial [Lachnospiraceae bacterium]|nr:Na/Pi cotransporter family protein [Lachnospiraceae bacterium]
MDLLSVIALLGGIGLFMYGMSLTSSSLEKVAGSGLERLLERLTTPENDGVSKLRGWGLGVGITAIIQSSTVTALMIMGLVNAGIMKIP